MDSNGRRARKCNLTVDGTDFQIPEPIPFWSGWWSHKFNGPALRYEVALGIQKGWICWINGPFAAGAWPDIKIFKIGLKKQLERGEQCEADGGYSGDLAIRAPTESKNLLDHRMKSDARSRHETVNRRFKQFDCMKSYRHAKEKHVFCFEAVAVITQLGLENGEPLYSVYYGD